MDKDHLHILAIESSCDDTSVAILEDRKVLSNVISTQEVHRKYGGVVPELASRSHEKNMIPVVQEALERAGRKLNDMDAIAFTQGPGLPGSLIVGNAFAKSLSMALNVPLIGINHMQAHILAHLIEGVHAAPPEFPFLCLTVSGGHTQIVRVNDPFDMEVLGETLDDAAGEAFDKIAKMLGMDYPGGPLLDKLAQQGDPLKFAFSKPKVQDFNYSFSGLKTAVLYFLKKKIEEEPNFIQDHLNDICASVQYTIVEILMDNLIKCAAECGIRHIAVAGGVSANSALRKELKRQEDILGWTTYVPPMQYCTDNAGMIGITAYYKYQQKAFEMVTSTSKARMHMGKDS